MNRIAIILSAAAITLSTAAQNKANFTLSNGEVESYNTEAIDRIELGTDGKVKVVPVTGSAVEYSGNLSRLSFLKNRTGKVAMIDASGWFEACYVEWENMDEASSYHVYVREASGANYTRLDNELVRNYGEYGRADAVGLRAGYYVMKVVPVVGGVENESMAAETPSLEVRAHDRGGFAHKGYSGIGAYNDDGTLKSGAKVIYVTANNAKTITTDVVTSSKGAVTTGTGLQDIIYLYQKGYDKTPIDFRIVGRIAAADMDRFDSSAEGLQIKGKNAGAELNITIEGIGCDATIHGFGFLLRNAGSVEIRNIGVMWFMDDGFSLDTDNAHCWIHNCDIFYGQKGGDSDQAKGDGSLDVKSNSKYMTFSYIHFWDAGKSSLCGMKSESGPNWMTYHHNWYDHSDSRHPRIRTMSVHVYNNYFDGVAKYGVGATTGADAFVENNYFRDCYRPMLTSKQGTDIAGDGTGTFSGENGGSIKAYGNIMRGRYEFRKWSEQNPQQFDAWVASSRDEKMPSSITALQGGDTYSNWDTDASLMYSYNVDPAEQVPAIVKGVYGAGRCNHGDFRWTFNNNIQDANYDVITELSNAIKNYDSRLVGFYEGDTRIGNGGVGSVNPGGDSSEGDEYPFGDYNRAEQSSEPDDPENPAVPFIAAADGTSYFRFDAAGKAQAEAWINDGTLSGGQLKTDFTNTTYTDLVGAYVVDKNGGEMIVKCPAIRSFKIEALRTGSFSGKVYKSTDGGKTYVEAGSLSGSKGIREFDFSAALRSSDEIYVKIVNNSTGNLNIMGLLVTK